MDLESILKYLINNFGFVLEETITSKYTPCIGFIGRIGNEKVFVKALCKEETEQNYLIYKDAENYGISFLFPRVVHYESSLLITEYIKGRNAGIEDIPKIIELYSKIEIEDSEYKRKFLKRVYYWLIKPYNIPINFNKIEEELKQKKLGLCIWDASMRHYIISGDNIKIIDPKNLLGIPSFDYGNLFIETLDDRLVRSDIFFYLGTQRKILKKHYSFY